MNTDRIEQLTDRMAHELNDNDGEMIGVVILCAGKDGEAVARAHGAPAFRAVLPGLLREAAEHQEHADPLAAILGHIAEGVKKHRGGG